MQYNKQAVRLKEELDNLRPLTKEDERRIMQKFRLDWNYHSNHLEGNSLTYGETKALILFGITAQGKPLRDHFEVTGHDEAVKWIEGVVKEGRPLTEIFIRELHKLLLKESYKIPQETPEGIPGYKIITVGEYKTNINHVKTRTGETFYFATPEETPVLMDNLVQWYRKKSEEKGVSPILLAAEFHYKFIRIHPFVDGNGRTARILMNFILMRFGFPPVIIKTEDKENYFSVLRQADAGILEPFLEYIAENLVRSLKIMILGAKGESIEEEDDFEKEMALLEQKFEQTRSEVKPAKNKNIVSFIYKNFIGKLFERFLTKSLAFDKFYLSSKRYFVIDDTKIEINWKFKLKDVYNLISKKTDINIIEFKTIFQGFNSDNYEKEEFDFGVEVTFYEHDYIVAVEGKELNKMYNETITPDETDNLIGFEIKRHQKFITNILEEIKHKK